MHNHAHNTKASALPLAFALALAFAVTELVGGLLSSSLALITDSYHAAGDALSIGIAWMLERISQRKEDARFPFGYRRFSLLGALFVSIMLCFASIEMIIHAAEHLGPNACTTEAKPLGMLLVALIGILLKGYAAYRLSAGRSLNERAVRLHMWADLYGLFAVALSGTVMLFVEVGALDAVLSILIALWILWNALRTLWQTLYILMETTPKGLSPDAPAQLIVALKGVARIENVRLWSLDGEEHLMTLAVQPAPEICSDVARLESLRTEICHAVSALHIRIVAIEWLH